MEISKDENLFNLGNIFEICNNDGTLISEILRLFVTDIPEDLTDMNNYLENKDYEGIRQVAHKLKQNIYTFKIISIANDIQRLNNIKSFNLNHDEVTTSVKNVSKILTEVVRCFMNLLDMENQA